MGLFKSSYRGGRGWGSMSGVDAMDGKITKRLDVALSFQSARGVTCLSGFQQALLRVPEVPSLHCCVSGRPLPPCQGWKEPGPYRQFPPKAHHGSAGQQFQLHVLGLGQTDPKWTAPVGELIPHLFCTLSSLRHCWYSCSNGCFLAWQPTGDGEQSHACFLLLTGLFFPNLRLFSMLPLTSLLWWNESLFSSADIEEYVHLWCFLMIEETELNRGFLVMLICFRTFENGNLEFSRQ